jgi:HSP20 family molecular chaperone IbpA
MRRIRLPRDVDLSKAETSFRNGVLQVVFPKAAAMEPKAIQLEVKTD